MEIWKDITGYEGKYQVSTSGSIRNILKNNQLKPSPDTKGYTRVNLWKDGSYKTKKIHRLVAEVFLKNDNDYAQVNHIDGDKSNNNIDNLEWCDQSYNIKHAYANNLLSKKGTKNARATIDEKTAIDIKNMLLGNLTHREIADIFQVSIHVVANIKNKKAWAYL